MNKLKHIFGLRWVTPYHFFSKSDKGFTLLIAVLVSSVLLGLGLAIFNIVSKEVILSSTGRDSQFSFYAADSGIECALYWDRQKNAFVFNSSLTGVTCGGAGVPFDVHTYNAGTHTMTNQFTFYLNGGSTGQCAIVSVYKTDSPATTTRIDSLGYNTCDTGNPRRLERAIRAQY